MDTFSRGSGCGASGSGYKAAMSPADEKLETVRKRLAWRASRRGIKEMDILVGGFADSRLPNMTPQELVSFEAVLEIPDQNLLSWVTRQEEVPENMRIPLLIEMLAFRPPEVKV
jgi:antitoxin CptB